MKRNNAHHLTGTSTGTGKNLGRNGDPVRVLVREEAPNKIIHRELDGLLRRHTDQLRHHTRVQTQRTLVLDDLSETVNRVVIQLLPNGDLSLVLHARLDEIDRVHHKGTESTRQTAQGKVVT